MSNILRAACVQATSGPNIEENIENVAHYIREAAKEGAKFVTTPENTCHLRYPAALKHESVAAESEHIGIPFFSELAKELGIALLIGSMSVRGENNKFLNRSYLFSQDGSLEKIYDKIHLFDVTLQNGEEHKESEVVEPGGHAVISPLNEHFILGLSICYDLRFAYLFRDMAQKGANVLCMPSAFTVPTGKAHWEVLLRARAIETGSYVLAPAQVGEHENGRKTYGHSMIIDPWGKVIECKEEGEGIIIADLDYDQVHKARSAIPALTHDRNYTILA